MILMEGDHALESKAKAPSADHLFKQATGHPSSTVHRCHKKLKP
jgi:hypothetical protein